MIPFYKIIVNDNDDTGVDFNSFVGAPAHMKSFVAFSKDQKRYEFNEEKRMVTGVMIATEVPIYRFDKQFGEHYVVFDSETIETIRKKFFKQGFANNVNTQHDANKVVKGAILIDSYTIHDSDPNKPKAPDFFKEQSLENGSWIATYFIEDDQLWKDVKVGKFTGFSVEGWFDKVQIKNNTNMSKLDKFMSNLKELFADEPAPQTPPIVEETFATATTADGKTLSYSGDITVDVTVFTTVDEAGENLPAPAGDHEITIEDGTVMIITLDEAGLLTSVEMNVNNDATMEEVMDAMSKMAKMFKAEFTAIKADSTSKIEKLEAQISAMKQAGKFKAEPKPTEKETKLSFRELTQIKSKN